MSKAWSKVRLGEILRRNVGTIALQPDQKYREIVVRWWGKGVALRREVTGMEITATRRFVAHEGQFIISRIDARKGAIAVVPAEMDGAIITNDFPVFDCDKTRVLPAYLGFLSQTASFVEECERASEGTTNRVRLQESIFLAREIKLPSLTEQQRIVARIEELAAQINEARTLKHETKTEVTSFWKVLSRMARGTHHPLRKLGEVVEFLDGRRVPLSKLQRSARKGKYPYYGASGIIDHIDDYIFEGSLLLLSEDGANLINRSTPIAFVATGKYWVNNHAHVLKPLSEVADLYFLTYALSDFDVSVFNFASAQAKLNQRYAGTIEFPFPPLPEQRRIVAELDALQDQVDALKRLQAETAEELDALLPSILDRAFKGEL